MACLFYVILLAIYLCSFCSRNLELEPIFPVDDAQALSSPVADADRVSPITNLSQVLSSGVSVIAGFFEAGLKREVSREISTMTKRLGDLNPYALQRMVFHRGFHSFTEVPDLPGSIREDGVLTRPIENTLAAFGSLWLMGADICECDVALTQDGELVLLHDDNLKRFGPRGSVEVLPDGKWLTVGEQSLAGLQSTHLVPPEDFLVHVTDKSVRAWAQIPTLKEVLEMARDISSRASAPRPKQLVVEIKADLTTADKTGKAVGEWVKANEELRKHIAVVMSFANDALLAYHKTEAPHGVGGPALMLLTVKSQNSTDLYQENPLKTYEGSSDWVPTHDDWTKPDHLDGYYMEVSYADQMQWISKVRKLDGICSPPDGILLGAWTYPGDPSSIEGQEEDPAEDRYQTMNAADVQSSVLLLTKIMGFTFVNTDFPIEFTSEGYKTLHDRKSNQKIYEVEDMGFPSFPG